MERYAIRGTDRFQLRLDRTAARDKDFHLKSASPASRRSPDHIDWPLQLQELPSEKHEEGFRDYSAPIPQTPTFVRRRPGTEPFGIDTVRRKEEPVGGIAIVYVVVA